MKLSFRALKNMLDFHGTAQDCADALAELGFPNDGTTEIGKNVRGVVLAKILEKKAHPQADRLSLLKVEVANQEVLPIVCGAKNMKEGDYVALARVGGFVPGKDGKGLELTKAKIRGEVSEGMCCSEVELGLGEESDGILIVPMEALGRDPDSLLGKDILDVLQIRDEVFEIDVTPNRGDALSVRGLARELAAKLNLKLKPLDIYRWKNPSGAASPSIESFDDAFGFAACLVKGVKLGATPWKWQQFLKAQGGRSINSLVDITNIVLFELGHPIHFFDADKVDPQTIGVRRARSGERLKLLNGQEIELHPEDLVIADANGALSLAGVMGGEASAVTENTKNILIEVASFNAARIRATSRRHQLYSESSHRFERGVTAFKIDEVMEHALFLLQQFSGFESAAGTKVISRQLQRPSCLWSRERVEAKLGKLEWSDNEIFDRLRRLDYELDARSSVPHLVFPWYRTDASELEDAMEDIARLLGYENLEKQPLRTEESVEVLSDLQQNLKTANRLLEDLVSKGFVECIHWSFSNPTLEAQLLGDNASIEIINPIHAEKPVLRRSLLPQLLDRARWNAANFEEEIRLVEIGPVFSWDEFSNYENSPAAEVWRLACVWYPRPDDRKRLWRAERDEFFEFKGMIESALLGFELNTKIKAQPLPAEIFHPKRRFQIGAYSAGELHPAIADQFDLKSSIYIFEIDLHVLGLRQREYRSASAYPAIDLDVSFSVDRRVSVQQILEAFNSRPEALVESIRPYDIYEKTGSDQSRAITFALRYRSKDRTLELEEAKKRHSDLVEAVIGSFPQGQLALR